MEQMIFLVTSKDILYHILIFCSNYFLASSSNSPVSNDLGIDLHMPSMSAKARATAAASLGHGRRHKGAFRSVLTPLATQSTHAHGLPSPTAHHSQSHLPAMSPSSQRRGGVVTRSRSRLAQQQAAHSPLSHEHTQLETDPANAHLGALRVPGPSPNALSASSVPPSVARSASRSAAPSAVEQNPFLPGNLFNGTSSENMRAVFDLTPPSNEHTLAQQLAAPKPLGIPDVEPDAHIDAGSCSLQVPGQGPFGSLLQSNAEPNVPDVLMDITKSKSSRSGSSGADGDSSTPHVSASMRKLQTATKGAGALSPLSVMHTTPSKSPAAAPSKQLAPPPDNTPSFPSPPSFSSIKRKRGSPLPSIMLSGSKRVARSPVHAAGVLQQRDKNTLGVPPGVQRPDRSTPSTGHKSVSRLKFSSSSPTGFYPTATVSLPSTAAAHAHLGQNVPQKSLSSSSGALPPYSPRSAFSSVAASAPNTIGGKSSSDAAFPLQQLQRHHFTSSPKFAEALFSDASKGNPLSQQSNAREPTSSSNLTPQTQSLSSKTPSGAHFDIANANRSLSNTISDENALPTNMLLVGAANGQSSAPLSESLASVPMPPTQARSFTVASSSSRSSGIGMVSPQHRKKRRRKDNQVGSLRVLQ